MRLNIRLGRRLWLLPTLMLALVSGAILSVSRFPLAEAQVTVHTLTQNDSGTQITIPVGDSVALRLSTDYTWDVQNSNTSVLTRPPVLLVQGVQGLWKATAPGEAVITADGRPNCSGRCPQFIVHFQATVDVVGASGGAGVTYQPGWNLVGGPDGTVFPTTLYIWDANSGQYTTLQQGQPLKSGHGAWAYFSQPTTVTLGSASVNSVSLMAPAGYWLQVANPSTTASASVSGADAVYSYDSISGSYSATTTLNPGQGAWAISLAGGTIQVTAAATPTPSPTATAQPQTQGCGTVQERGPTGVGVQPGTVLNGADAQQAAACFAAAYQQCAPTSLTVKIMGVDTSQTHVFSLQGSASACTVSDTVTTLLVPRGATAPKTYTCTGLVLQSAGLLVQGCGDLGDIGIPAPAAP